MDMLWWMFQSRLAAIRVLGVHVGGIVSGCVLVLLALPAVMQCTFEASDQSVDASGRFQVGDWEWDELVKK